MRYTSLSVVFADRSNKKGRLRHVINKRIAILSGGGDCPGTNAVIRAITKKAILEYGIEVIGINDGFDGLIHNRFRTLHYDDVSGILTLGGTILGTSNISNPYKYPVRKGSILEFEDASQTAIANVKKLNVDCLVCIGGMEHWRLPTGC